MKESAAIRNLVLVAIAVSMRQKTFLLVVQEVYVAKRSTLNVCTCQTGNSLDASPLQNTSRLFRRLTV
jgi:hypothetical protein